MAKTLAKPSIVKKVSEFFYSPASHLSNLRKKLHWVETEKQTLAEVYEEEKQRKLSAIKNKYDSMLAKPAFKACDKAEYSDKVMADKLQKFDIKHYMQHRAVNHALSKAIFKAMANGECFQSALDKHTADLKKVKAKRVAYVNKLQEEKQAFIAKNNQSDSAEYDALLAKLKQDYKQKEEQLNAKYSALITKKVAKLDKIIADLESKIEKVKAKIKNEVTLDEGVLLSVKGLKMYFGGLKAVDDLTFDVKKGEIFGLIGPNGAGKTTVFNCITRFYDATGGDIYFENKQGEVVDMRNFKVHDVILQGISRTFQNVELVKEVSVLENLLMACTREYQSNFWIHALGLPIVKKEDKILTAKAMRILKFMGLENYAAWYAMGLPYGILKKVEIARALMMDAKLIIMDEPAAGLNDSETAELTQTIRRIRDEFNVTILLVEHDMKLVMSVCDTVCAISFGQMLAIGTTEEIQNNKAVQDAYLGVAEDE